jgi:Outer membrane protein beta-barrel domain
MRHLMIFAVALSLALFGVPAHAGTWSLGTNLGISFVQPEDTDNQTNIAWPASAELFQPGIRIGYAKEQSPHEFYADTGLLDANGDFHTFLLTGNYQYNFASQTSTNFYLTGGLGLANVGFDVGPTDVGATSLLFGVGGGARFRVSDGHGTIRAEVRYDRVTEGDDEGVEVIDEAGIFAFKFGFDLWLR